MKNKKATTHKPTIETLINGAAIAVMTYGVNHIIQDEWVGYIAVLFAVSLEFFKYWGRHINLW